MHNSISISTLLSWYGKENMAEQRTADLALARVSELREQIERLREHADRLNDALRRAQEQLAAWQIILKAEAPEMAKMMALDGPHDLQQRVAVLRSEALEAGKRNALILNEKLPAGTNMMEATRMFIKDARDGVTPKEILDYLSSRNFKPSEGFASNALFKLRKRGKVVEQDNRYYWKENQTPAQGGRSED
jgi:DNA-binding transcriptional MerR regulator